MELMLVGEVILKVAMGCKCFWAEGATMVPRELTEEAVEVKMAERRGDVLTVPATKEGKVTVVHSDAMGCRVKVEREE
jgi:hypothetical protein